MISHLFCVSHKACVGRAGVFIPNTAISLGEGVFPRVILIYSSVEPAHCCFDRLWSCSIQLDPPYSSSLSRTLPHPSYMLFICFQRWDLESGGSVSNGINPQWSLNHRLEQRRDCAEWGWVGGDTVVRWGFRHLGRVDSSHQGQQG